MESIVLATWGLVAATVILASINVLQLLSIRRQAQQDKQRAAAQMAILVGQTNALTASAQAANASAAAQHASAQATQAMAEATAASAHAANASAAALNASAQATQAMAQATAADAQASQAMAVEMALSASASQAMADEMLETRRSANPLRLRVELQEPRVSGGLAAFLCNDGDRAEVILETVIFVGGPGSGAGVVEPTNWGNLYLEPKGRYPLVSTYQVGRGDLLTLRVTGRPKDGVEQTREFLYRIKSDGTLEDLDQPRQEPPMVAYR